MKEHKNHRWLAGGLFLGGLAALTLTGLMNFKLGQSLGADYLGGLIQGSTHIVIDGFAALGFVTAGVLIARKNMVAGALSLLLSLSFATYSVANIIGYSASNRVAVVAASALNQQRFTQMADNASATRAEALKWAMATATDKSKYRSMREPMADLVIKLATAPQAELKAATARETMPDAQAKIIADLSGKSQQSAQIALSIAMAVLLVIAKAFGFGFGGFLWPEKTDQKSVKRETVKPDEESAKADNVVAITEALDPLACYVASKDNGEELAWPDLYEDYKVFCKTLSINRKKHIEPLNTVKFREALTDQDGPYKWRRFRETSGDLRTIYRKPSAIAA